MKALYAYFGEFGFFDTDIPGHSFYQIGLLSALSEKYNVEKFDVFNYIDNTDTPIVARPTYSDDKIGQLMTDYTDRLVDKYRISSVEILNNLESKEYDFLFLKARFRNLSTLSKKLKDAVLFETLIKRAIESGFNRQNIIVLDTDLSMSQPFMDRLTELGVTVAIPSITFSGIGKQFLTDCLAIHRETLPFRCMDRIVYHGNLDFSNYKEGHSKNPIIDDIIRTVDHVEAFDGTKFQLLVFAKDSQAVKDKISLANRVALIPRYDRPSIWHALSTSLLSLNISKDLYLERNFIPARVYEAVIAGIIPVSYRSGQHPAMTFSTVDEFYEICKFLTECSPSDYYKILESIASKL